MELMRVQCAKSYFTEARESKWLVLSFSFECLQCGKCCKDLVIGGRGLLLFPHEVILFPKGVVQPCLGKGISHRHKNFKVWANQLNKTHCPNLQNKICKIYNQRPLACRAYPYSFVLTDLEQELFQVAPECTAIIEAKQTGVFMEQMQVTESKEILAARELGAWMMKFKKGGSGKRTPRVYDLNLKRWERFSVSKTRKKKVRETFESIKEKRMRSKTKNVS